MPAVVYTPRWLYRFFAFIQRLPIRGWLLVVLVTIVGGLAMHLDAWRQGLLPVGQLNSYLITVSLYIVAYPGIWMLLDQRARVALKDFFQAKAKNRASFEARVAAFVSLPSIPANIVFLLGSLSGVVLFQGVQQTSPLVGRVLPLWDLISWIPITGIMFMLIYRMLRQAVLIPRLFAEIEVNLFDPSPVYALSRYASQASVALLVINYALVFASVPDFAFTAEAVLFQILVITASLVFFFAPLASINQRMRRAKGHLLAEIGRDLEDMYGRVRRAVKTEKFDRVGELRNAISALKDEIETIRKTPTWPWQPDALRNLLAPMLLPIIVYLVQRFFGSMLGF